MRRPHLTIPVTESHAKYWTPPSTSQAATEMLALCNMLCCGLVLREVAAPCWPPQEPHSIEVGGVNSALLPYSVVMCLIRVYMKY